MSRWGAEPNEQQRVRFVKNPATVPQVVLAHAQSAAWKGAIEGAFPVSESPTSAQLCWLAELDRYDWSAAEFRQALVIVEVPGRGSDPEWERIIRAVESRSGQQTWVAVTDHASQWFLFQWAQAGFAAVLEHPSRVNRLEQIAKRHFCDRRGTRLSLEQRVWLNLPWGNLQETD